MACDAAGDDRDFAVWLVDAGNAFADFTEAFPRDLDNLGFAPA
jgi:hypothetical protein